MSTRPAGTTGHRRRTGLLAGLVVSAVVLVVLVVLAILSWPRPRRPAYPTTSDGPGAWPSRTSRAVMAPPEVGAPPRGDDDSAEVDGELADLRLWVVAGGLNRRTKFWYVSTQKLRSWRFWPTPWPAASARIPGTAP
jgi:hypothetical protein